MSVEGKKFERKQFAFNGAWNPTDDPLIIGEENYSNLENCRYNRRRGGLEAVQGYTKINTVPMSTTPGTYLKGRSGIQLRSPHTQKTRVLVQALNAAEDESGVIENLTEIPDQGDFEATALHVDVSGAGLGRFSKWPGGNIAYCNGKEAKVYAGDEKDCDAFLTSTEAIVDEVVDVVDHTVAVANLLEVPPHVAIIGGGVDSYTKLLLHCDGEDEAVVFVDSSPDTHTVGVNGSAKIDDAQSKFGPTAGWFDGNSDWLNIDDDHGVSDHWNMGTGNFTIGFWIRHQSLPGDNGRQGYFQQYQDASNYVRCYMETQVVGALTFRYLYFEINDGGTIKTLGPYWMFGLQTNQWDHVAIVRGWDGSSDNIAFLFNGQLVGDLLITGDDWPDLDADFEVGRAFVGANRFFHGWIDEFRVSKGVARWTENFSPPTKQYGTSRLNGVIGSTRPLKGVKFYIPTANIKTSTLTFKEWNGNSWSALDITDNTASGGVSLTQTGTVTWPHTQDSAKVKYLENRLLYWYKYELTAGDAQISHVTLDAGWQDVGDIWDGLFRTTGRFRYKVGTDTLDGTMPVNVETPAGIDAAGSYTVDIGGLAITTDFIDIGLEERACALYIKMFEGEAGKVNTTGSLFLLVQYWTGEDWKTCSGVHDGTRKDGTMTFGQSGTISWDYPLEAEEQAQNKYGATLYYYRLQFYGTGAMSASVLIDLCLGIPAPKPPSPVYKFPFMFRGRPMLCAAIGNKEGNKVDFGIAGSTEGFNGVESSFGIGALYFGGSEDLSCACELYNRFGANIYHMGVFCKDTETYLLTGYSPDNYTIRKISGSVGCPAPLTMDTVEMNYGMSEGVIRNIAGWLSYNGPYLFDAGVLEPITNEIECYFDKSDTRCINFEAIDRCRGWMDPDNLSYNLGLCSGVSQTEVNVWLAFDLVLKRWYRPVPAATTDPYPQLAFRVVDENGAQYVYGCRDNGYMMRLEKGADWDGEDMVQKIAFADQVPTKNIWDHTNIRHFKLFFKSISEAVNVTGNHYKDGESTARALRAIAANGSNRYVRNVQKFERKGFSHKFELEVTTSSTVKGVPFLAWGYTYEKDREDL